MATFTTDPPDPLRFNVSIVDIKNGTPTQEFLRQWNRQRAVNVTVENVTVDLTAIENAITALESDVADIQAVDIVAGVGLAGGGNISGPSDVTIDLEDTAVTPGTYGNATNSAQITVDQQGRITAAANVPITGGGGSGGGGGGAWSFIGAYTPDSTGVITVPLPGDGEVYRLIVDGITFTNDSVSLHSRLSVGGTPQTGGTDYAYVTRQVSSGSATTVASTGAAQIVYGGAFGGNAAGEEDNIDLIITGADSASRQTLIRGLMVRINSFADLNLNTVSGRRLNAEINDEILFYASAGTLDGGTVYLYKLVTS